MSDPPSFSHAVPLWSVTGITGGISIFQIPTSLSECRIGRIADAWSMEMQRGIDDGNSVAFAVKGNEITR